MSRKVSVDKNLHHENFLSMKDFMSRPFSVTHSFHFYCIVNEEVLVINISFTSISSTRKKFLIAIILVIKIIMSWSFSLRKLLNLGELPSVLCCARILVSNFGFDGKINLLGGCWGKPFQSVAHLGGDTMPGQGLL